MLNKHAGCLSSWRCCGLVSALKRHGWCYNPPLMTAWGTTDAAKYEQSDWVNLNTEAIGSHRCSIHWLYSDLWQRAFHLIPPVQEELFWKNEICSVNVCGQWQKRWNREYWHRKAAPWFRWLCRKLLYELQNFHVVRGMEAKEEVTFIRCTQSVILICWQTLSQ